MSVFSLWSGRGLDPDRAVQILAESGQDRRFGSGYRVSDDMVLTAAHVLPPGQEVRITVWTWANASVTGRRLWCRPDLDLALVRVPAARDWGAVPAVAWGRVDRSTKQHGGVPFSFIGYPVANVLENVRSKDQRWGLIPPRSYEEHNRYALHVDGSPPVRVDGTHTLWEGVSGAAVFSEGLLVAVVRSDQMSTEPGQLLASPVETAAADPVFQQLLGIDEQAPLPHSPVGNAAGRPAEVVLWRVPPVGGHRIVHVKQRLETGGLAVRAGAEELGRDDILTWVRDAAGDAALTVVVVAEGCTDAAVEQAVSGARMLTQSHPTVRIAVLVAPGARPGTGVTFFDAEAGMADLVDWCVGGEPATLPDTRRDERPSRAPCLLDPYPMSTSFVGRRRERDLLSAWLSDRWPPVLVVTAIGGMGKSALAWTWLTADVFDSSPAAAVPAPHSANPLSGVFWFSFYRPDASARTFIRSLLAYLRPDEDWSEVPLSDAAERIRAILQDERVLIVMDGIERELRAYSRLDAPRLSDQHAAKADRDTRSATDPVAGRLLRMLCDPTLRAKVLITTRLFPADLEDTSGFPLAACQVESLESFAPQDTVDLFRTLQVRGSDQEILAACRPYGFHPLTIRLLAGMVVEDLREPLDIRAARRKVVEPTSDLRRVHVLSDSYEALDAVQQLLLTRLSASRTPMNYSLIESLAEFAEVTGIDDALSVLIARGLVMFDRSSKTFELHPIVRNFAYARLLDRTEVHEQLAEALGDQMEEAMDAIEETEDFKALLDDFARIQPGIVELFYQLVQAGAHDVAVEVWDELLAGALPALGDYGTGLSCLEMLCADEEKFRAMVDEALVRAGIRGSLAEFALRLGRPRYGLEVLQRQRTDVWADPDDDEEDEVMTRCMATSVEARCSFMLGLLDRSEGLLLHLLDELQSTQPEVALPGHLAVRQAFEAESRMLLAVLYAHEGRVEDAREQRRLHVAAVRAMLGDDDDGEEETAVTRLIREASGLTEMVNALDQGVVTGEHTELFRRWRDWLHRWLDVVSNDSTVEEAQRIALRLQLAAMTQSMLAAGVDLGDDQVGRLDVALEDTIRDARRTGVLMAELGAMLALAELRFTRGQVEDALALANEVLSQAQRNELVIMIVPAHAVLVRILAPLNHAAAGRSLAAAERMAFTEGKRHFTPILTRARDQLVKALPSSS